MPWHVMPQFDCYERARQEFEWALPDRFNPAVDCLRKHESPGPANRIALVDAATGESYTYEDVDDASGRLANALDARGIEPGDRVGVVAPQRPETPIAHMACWKLGAVTVPMSTLFGPDALADRLEDADARAVVFDPTVRSRSRRRPGRVARSRRPSRSGTARGTVATPARRRRRPTRTLSTAIR